jgi:hypothetical protein
MNDIVDSIRKYCPKAVFSMDISPWKITSWQKAWFSKFKMTNFTFMNTSGGSSRADQTYISDSWSTDCPTWAWVFKTYGTPILADADYGTGGGSTGYDTRWDNVTNLSSRIQDGVIGISHYNPSSSYASTIQGLRSKIPAPPKCPTGNTVIESKFSIKAFPASNQLISGEMEFIDLSGKTVAVKKVTVISMPSMSRDAACVAGRSGAYFVKYRAKSSGVFYRKIIVAK